MGSIIPDPWFVTQAEDAAACSVSTFPDTADLTTREPHVDARRAAAAGAG